MRIRNEDLAILIHAAIVDAMRAGDEHHAQYHPEIAAIKADLLIARIDSAELDGLVEEMNRRAA